MEGALAAVRGGERCTLAILGEAGIGKSALLAQLTARAEAAGLLVLSGRAAEHEHEVPFSLLIDALDEHVATMHPSRIEAAGAELGAVLPSVGEAAPPVAPAERYRLHRALGALLDQLGRQRPYALVLDDVHWADDASIEAVLHLLRRAPRAPHLTVFAARPGELAPRVLDAARSAPGWTELRPAPLDREAALELLPSELSADVRERMRREAGGNPLFLLELGKLGGEAALPATLLAAVAAEVARVPEDARALIEAAAVAGDPFDLELAAAAAGIEPGAAGPALDALVGADLVRASAPSFHFRHPLIRRAVYDGSPPAWRLAAHERVAEALAARGADPVARAYHVEQFARPGDEEALALLVEAARAAEGGSPAAAAARYATALRLLPYGDDERRAELLAPMGRALAYAGRLEDAVAALDEAISLSPPEARGELVDAAVEVDFLLERFDRAGARLEHALEDASPAVRPWLVQSRAIVATSVHDFAEMDRWFARVEDEARTAATPELLLSAAGSRAVLALFRGEGSKEVFEEATRQLAEIDDAVLGERLQLGWSLGQLLLQSERYRDAVTVLERALSVARASNHGAFTVMFHSLLAISKQPLLDLDGALEHLDIAEEMARLQELDALCAITLSRRVGVLTALGERAEAERAAAASDEMLERVPASQPAIWSATRNAIARLAHDPERMLAAVAAIAGEGLERIPPPSQAPAVLPLVRAMIALGRVDEAARWSERLSALAERMPLPATVVRAERVRAEVLLARGEAAQAVVVARAAAERAVAIPAEELAARLLAGRALVAAGERDAGLAELQYVADAAARAGAAADRDAAARELRRAGARVAAGARRAGDARAGGTDGLTERERDVAELVARGRTNREVAEALFLSEKTVENHLSRVYAKLGLRSRAELVAALGSQA
jgi:ATP/maltotriose-dependent transcriptional regulator MalT